jgi:amidohydrolase
LYPMLDSLRSRSVAYHADTVAHRRHLHQNPELSFAEYDTAQYVAQVLTGYGLSCEEGVAGTGVVALIEGRNPESRCIALRADMDALPIVEANDVPYKSQRTGVMHACGHDAHTASLLTVARLLNESKAEFEGTVKLIFQPGEEKAPGGASQMIAAGVLGAPAQPQAILGQHVQPFMPVGTIGFREGTAMASADEIYFTVHGKGGHGAMPERCIDPVLITSHLIVAVQQIVSRRANPKLPSVLSFGRVIAEGATNIIPNSVAIQGTFRTLDVDWREDALIKIASLAKGLVESMDGRIDINIVRGYPHLKNDPALTRKMRARAEEYMGKANVIDLDLWMAAEDFAYYTHHIPGCFYRLGTGNQARGITSSVHTPTFDIDEAALAHAPGLMAYLALG